MQSSQTDIYADDTGIIIDSDVSVVELETTINNNLKKLCKWLQIKSQLLNLVSMLANINL